MSESVKTVKRVLPGAILISRIDIYDGVSPDGQRGGTPHLHLACDEMYYGLSGEGFVELIHYDGFERIPVSPNKGICFTPGTLHRAVNPNGDLSILVIMQNSGLPERGDVAVCFPQETCQSEEAYNEGMRGDDETLALRRRDLGVAGFIELKEAFAVSLVEGRRALDRFYEVALDRTRASHGTWKQLVEEGPAGEVTRSRGFLADLEAGSTESLREGRAFHADAPEARAPGFCGHIHPYRPGPDTGFDLEGIRS